jgi:dTDP-4-amino-4,6-dideoxygalactose transaminase
VPIHFAQPDITPDDHAAVARVLNSGWLTTGDECHALEDELRAVTGARHVVAVSSCTAAMEIALAALDLRPGARVGVPTWTFASTALTAARAGARVVLLDVEPDTLNLSPDSLAAALDQGLDAVMPVHFGGVPVDAAVHKLCADAEVPIVEDAAHALGAIDERGPIGSTGLTCFSFYATKNLTTGEGGALTTDSDDVAGFARAFRQHGLSEDAWRRYRPGGKPGYDLVAAGIKANLPDLLAALGRSQLARFPQLQQRRRHVVDRYRERLADAPGLAIVPPRLAEGGADHLFVVALPEHVDRDKVIAHLGQREIGISIHFRPLHRFAWFDDADHAELGPTGVADAEAAADRILSLPLHPGLSDDDVDTVCDALIEAITP